MKLTIVALVCIFAYEVSCGLQCKKNDKCLTESQMGPGWGGYFKGQTTAPCLTGIFGDGKVWCFTSKGGSLTQCSCWDDNVKYDNKWCNPGLYGAGNTMCIYEDGAVSSCGDVKSRKVTSQAMKDAIVKKHNDLRSKVAKGKETKGVNGRQPKAANMRQMVWNDELAEVAQRWVDQCTNGHDKNRRTGDFTYVGQNWAWTMSWKQEDQTEVAKKMVQMWYDEVKDIAEASRAKSGSPGSTGVVGHYTQVVWAESSEVGCGWMTSVKNKNFENVLVCNYGPGGNMRGSPVYIKGNPGSKCPSGTKKTSAGLCA